MAFDLVKKGMAGLSKVGHQVSDALGGKGGPKAGLRSKSFEEGDQALKPEKATPTKAKNGVYGDDRTLMQKADDYLGIGKTFKTQDWIDRSWKHVQQVIQREGPGGLATRYWTHFYPFAVSEHSAENVDALRALKGGMARDKFYHRFLSKTAPQEINVAGQKAIRELGDKGEFDKIDFDQIETDLIINLNDTFGRAQFDDKFMSAMFRQVNQTEAPGSFSDWERSQREKKNKEKEKQQ